MIVFQSFGSNETTERVVKLRIYPSKFSIEWRAVRYFATVDFNMQTLVTNVAVTRIDFALDVVWKARTATSIPVVGQSVRLAIFVRLEVKRQNRTVRLNRDPRIYGFGIG